MRRKCGRGREQGRKRAGLVEPNMEAPDSTKTQGLLQDQSKPIVELLSLPRGRE